MSNLLDNINNPNDIKSLKLNELELIAEEARKIIINTCSIDGGHLAPNLGVVELTIALHYVFNSPIDKFVFDVSHQCYTHKILTGRKDFKINPKITGYTNKIESEHDFFNVGHTSTSVSLATGLAKARDMQGRKENVIAIIGDGSLSGGEAYEGLNNGALLNSNFIVILNDNEMSIAENYGGVYSNLQKLRETNGEYENNYFKAMGYDYMYLENGNNIQDLVNILNEVKDTNKPIVVHVHTHKGKGYSFAENAKEDWHWANPFDIETGKPKNVSAVGMKYCDIVTNTIEKMIEKKEKVMVINPACRTSIIGLAEYKTKYPEMYTDVGIAEEHSIAYLSGLATGGVRPFGIYLSSFIQRAYDQVLQDLCLNDVPATIIVERAEISGADATHVGMYDIPMLSNMPNLIYMAPKNGEELEEMIKWANIVKSPVGIRIPDGSVPILKNNTVEKIELYKFEKLIEGKEIAIIGVGKFFKLAEEVYEGLTKLGYTPTLINPRFLSGIDEKMLEGLLESHSKIITLEDGILSGGFGEKVSGFYSNKDMKVYSFGADKEFINNVQYAELMKKYKLNVEDIIENTLNKN